MRILLKLSGEALAGETGFGLDQKVMAEIAQALTTLHAKGVEIALVIGGGNFWRGRSSQGMDRVKADYIGMLATTMNALAMSDSLEKHGLACQIMSALDIPKIHELFDKSKALTYLAQGKVVICAGGTGNPFFSTDSTAALRGAELDVDLVLKATLVDGVYDKDPHKFADAKMYKELSFDEVLSKNLQVMDASAAALCRDNQLRLRVFNLAQPANILKIVEGEDIGTLIHA